MSPDDFINWLALTAQAICKTYHLPANVLIAQGALESFWGSATIGQFNFFGRKYGGTGNYIELPTQEDDGTGNLYTITAKFQEYDSLDAAGDDWAQLMELGSYDSKIN
jgi:flagellum-specific peptidoglycan hydrolase FlgJ